MKNSNRFIIGAIIALVMIVGSYFAITYGGFSLTGAATNKKECVGADELSYFNACENWEGRKWVDKPETLKILSDVSARQLCDRLLREYKAC